MASKKKAAKKTGATVTLQYFRSGIGAPAKHKLVLKSLGFKRLNQVVTRVDTDAVRGMVAQVPHLVRIIDE
ncbi:MAG: 50S ribosomal protein L30 [Acidobacteria bacterium]|nr:50S ribosomal protein L30 [Acidobacteriota bacterium]